MTRILSSSEVRDNWDDLVASASAGDDVIVEADGTHRVILISTEALEAARDKQRRAEAMQRFEAPRRSMLP